ncbi:hypothetical protein ACMGD3_00540 [Lysinibacillus sphaericus]|uniref:hypothetical protein n=1 Tax=Lysinibacillus sphaericus TaxID=1421 RepID=UPI001C5D47C3
MNIIALLDKVKRQLVGFSFSSLIGVEPIGLLRSVDCPPSLLVVIFALEVGVLLTVHAG